VVHTEGANVTERETLKLCQASISTTLSKQDAYYGGRFDNATEFPEVLVAMVKVAASTMLV
jgi:hypothetical protein